MNVRLYPDLLTLNHGLERGRDPVAPASALIVGYTPKPPLAAAGSLYWAGLADLM